MLTSSEYGSYIKFVHAWKPEIYLPAIAIQILRFTMVLQGIRLLIIFLIKSSYHLNLSFLK